MKAVVRSVLKAALYRALAMAAAAKPGRRPLPDAREARRILLSEIALMGDVASLAPSLAAARALWPGAHIDLLVPAPFAALFEGDGRADSVLRLRDMGTASYVSALLAVRRRRYDLALSMSPGLRNAGVAVLAGAKASAGYLMDTGFPPHHLNRQSVEGLGVALEPVPDIGPETHIADRGLRVLEALGAEVAGAAQAKLVLDPGSVSRIESRLASEGILPSGPFAVLHPSAGEHARRWPRGRFVELARRLRLEEGLGVAWIGGKPDARLLRRIRAHLGEPSVVLTGRRLDELSVLVRRAALFVGNDSGPMHLAGAVGTPLVGIFGPGDPARLLPRGGPAAAVRAPSRLVADVSVDEVLSAVRQVLQIGDGSGDGR